MRTTTAPAGARPYRAPAGSIGIYYRQEHALSQPMTKTTHRLFTHTDSDQRERLIGQVFGQMFLLCRSTIESYPSDLFWDIEWMRTYINEGEHIEGGVGSTFLWSYDSVGTLIGTEENYIRQRKHAYRLTVRKDRHWWVLDVEELA